MSSDGSTPTHDSKQFGEYIQHKTQTEDRNRYKSRFHQGIENANKSLERGDYSEAGRILRDEILHAFEKLEYTKPAVTYHGKMADEGLDWHWYELDVFMDSPDQYVEAATDPESGGSGRLLDGMGPAAGEQSAHEVIRRSVESMESISAYHSITPRELKSRVDVVGFTGKTGEHIQKWDMDMGDPVKSVTTQAGALKTLFLGGTGMGKSTGVEMEAEDYYQAQFQDNADEFKMIDLVGLRDGENWFYDIPQQQEPLRDIREEMGMPADFTESDDLEQPTVEILHPLTPGLKTEQLPYNTEDEQFTVTPFVVPAASLPQNLLVSFVSERLSDGQEETIRSAYEAVDRNEDDWPLKSLADEIRSREELSDKDRATAINILHSLQDVGFIRTSDHEHCIDWREIFTNTETITVFSQAKCPHKMSQLIGFAYLVDEIVRKREKWADIPQCVVMMRELWKVTPHKQRQSAFPLVAALQESIGQRLAEIFRENRHSGIHLLADTQQPSDLLKPVREMFNRYVVYSTNKDTLKEIFSWTTNSKYDQFWYTMSAKAGEAGIVGQVQPAIDEREIEFISPVQYAPPSHHHRISPGDNVGSRPDLNGWTARCKYIDAEELRRPADVDHVDWGDSLPPELRIEAESPETDSETNVEGQPVKAFVEKCLTSGSTGQYIHKSDMYDAFNEFRHKHGLDRWVFDQGAKTKFGNRLNKYFPDDLEVAYRSDERAYIGVQWTTIGGEVHENAHVDVENTASPIRTE
jgi:hypothetical protein